MKRSLFQFVIATAAAIFIGYAAAIVFASTYGMHEETNAVTEYYDEMASSKEMFVELSDEFQIAAGAIKSMEGYQILRTAGSKAMALDADGNLLTMDEFLEKAYSFIDLEEFLEKTELNGTEDIERSIEALFGETESGSVVYNIAVTPLSVQFYTSYYETAGCVGILYEFTIGNTVAYETIEIGENWQLFYIMER